MSRNKKLLYAAFIVAMLLAVVLIGAHSGDFTASLRAMLGIPRGYTFLCVLCVFGGILMQALSASSALGAMGYHLPFHEVYRVSLLGEFYSFITPGASGGQPMQVFHFHNDGIPVGDATTALVLHYIFYHAELLMIDVVFGILHRTFVVVHIGANIVFLIIGFLFNLGLVAGALLLSFYQRPVRWLLRLATAFMKRWHIGDSDRLQDKFSRTADAFYRGTRFIARHRLELLRQIAFAAGRILCMTSIFYFIYRGLGQRGAGYGSLVTLGVMQYTSAGYTPLPGASGAQEGIFSLYFDKLLPGDLMLSGLLTWRFIAYYMVLMVGGLVAIWPKKRPDRFS